MLKKRRVRNNELRYTEGLLGNVSLLKLVSSVPFENLFEIFWPHRLTVRTLPSHGRDRGSIPLEAICLMKVRLF